MDNKQVVRKQNEELTEQSGKKKRKRPDRTAQTNPGDNRKYIEHSLKLAKYEKANLKSPEEVSERIKTYFQICADDDMKPSVAGLALCLGTSRSYLWEIREGKKGSVPEVANLLKKAMLILELQMNDYMQNGKINPASGIFLMKNHFDYKDEQKITVKPNEEKKDPEALLEEASAILIED